MILLDIRIRRVGAAFDLYVNGGYVGTYETRQTARDHAERLQRAANASTINPNRIA
jgi:hypothetical protein